MPLAAWRAITDNSQRIIACFGDSVTEGTGGNCGGYPEILRQLMTKKWASGGYGFYGTWRSHWVYTSGANAWDTSQGGSSKPWNIGPYDGGIMDVNTKVVIGNTASKIATWYRYSYQWPAQLYSEGGPAIDSFTLWVVDSTGSGTFSYSIDGGAWTNVSYSWSNNNTLARITINSPIANNLRVRGANAAGTATNLYLVGIEPKVSTPGSLVHNMGAASEFTFSSIRLDNSKWGGWLDIIKPKVATIIYTNDLDFGWDSTSYQNRLQAFIDKVAANGGETIIITMWGQNGRNAANYTAQRSIHQNLANVNNLYHLNLYDLVGDFSAAQAAGLISDNLHPNNNGYARIADYLWSYLGVDTNTPHFKVIAN